MEDHLLWQQASNIQTSESLSCLSNFFKLEWVSCPFLTAYYTAFCFLLQSSACCPQPMERSLHTLLFFWELAATFLLCYNLTHYMWFFFPPSCSRTSSLFFNSISTSLVSSSLYPHSWKLSFFSFIHFHSFFSSHLAVICISLFCACHGSSLITIALHSYLVSRCIYSSCIFSSEDSTTMQQ